MHDFVTSARVANSDKQQNSKRQYKGLVLFAYVSQTASATCGMCFFPNFAEVQYDYLAVLAHEAGHLVQSDPSMAHFRRGKVVSALDRTCRYPYLFGQVAVQPTDKFLCKNSLLRRVAGELLADLYATCVAGVAYPRVLCKYHLPLLVDTVDCSPDNGQGPQAALLEEVYVSLVVSSLKAKTSLMAIHKLDYDSNPETRDEVRRLNEYVSNCETLSMKIAEAATNNEHPTNPLFQAAVGGNQRDLTQTLVDLQKNVEEMAEAVSDLAPELRDEYVAVPYYGRSRPDVELAIQEARRRFCEREIDLVHDIIGIWQNEQININKSLLPRHLVALLGEKPPKGKLPVSRHAILLALAHHPSILARYRQVQPRPGQGGGYSGDKA